MSRISSQLLHFSCICLLTELQKRYKKIVRGKKGDNYMHCFDALAATRPSCLRLDKMHCLKEKKLSPEGKLLQLQGSSKTK